MANGATGQRSGGRRGGLTVCSCALVLATAPASQSSPCNCLPRQATLPAAAFGNTTGGGQEMSLEGARERPLLTLSLRSTVVGIQSPPHAWGTALGQPRTGLEQSSGERSALRPEGSPTRGPCPASLMPGVAWALSMGRRSPAWAPRPPLPPSWGALCHKD